MYKKQGSILQDEKHMAKVVSLQLQHNKNSRVPGKLQFYTYT